MTTATIEELIDRVRSVLAASDLRDAFDRVDIEPALSGDDWEVLRVNLRMIDPRRVDPQRAIPLIDAIVGSLLEVDDRFPSVHFAEAA